MISDQIRRQKSREVSSRYLSSTTAPPSPPLGSLNHNNHTLSPNSHNPKPKQKHKHTAFIRGLWPSSTSKSSNDNQPISLADHLGNERRKHRVQRSENSPVLSRQKSCSEFRHSEKHSKFKNNLKEHHTPIFGGSASTRFTGKLLFPGRPSVSSPMSSKSSKSSDVFDSNQVILPGRLSVDENALRRRSSYYQMRSDSFSDNSESSDLSSPFTASYMAPTLSSKRSGLDVPLKCISPSTSMHNSPKNSNSKTAMKRVNSLSSSSPTEWVSSPSRLGSPSYSSLKPPTSSKGGKKTLLHMGLDLIKGKKGSPKSPSYLALDTGTNMEHVHQLRLLQNSLMQWRYTNARAQHVHENIAAQSEKNLLCGYESMANLRQSVVQKRLQLQKEKQEIKLNLILHSQTKLLEAWGDIERRHILDVSVMKDYLHAVVCMIPLTEGAKVDIESATMAFQQTSQMVATIKSMLSSVSPTAHETMVTLSELAEVVNQENLLLEECFEHLRIISTLEIQERILRCGIIAMDSLDEQPQQKLHKFT